MGTNNTSNTVEIQGVSLETIGFKIMGTSPLIVHRWSEKAKKEMLDKQMKKAKQGKKAKNLEEDYLDSIYFIGDKPKTAAQLDKSPSKYRYGFPAVGIKAAAVGACRFVDGMPMTEARGAFHVDGEFIEIFGLPEMRVDMVRLNGKTADIRSRGMFKEWSSDITVTFNANSLSMEQIINLFNVAGFSQGLGEWRPEKNGGYGRFSVASD